jgi:hypothetical protein
MANTINEPGVEMARKMNAQAVINKIRILQKEYGADEDGCNKWKLQLAAQKRIVQESEMRSHASSAEETMVLGKNKDSSQAFSAEDMMTLEKNKDIISECLGLFRSKPDEAKQLFCQIASHDKENIGNAMQLASHALEAHRQTDSVGEGNLLPKLLSTLAEHGKNVEDWPVMMQIMSDFEMVLGAKSLCGLRYSDRSKDFWSYIFQAIGKGGLHQMRGFFALKANPDDDGGKASRKRKRARDPSIDDDDDEISEHEANTPYELTVR